MSDLNENLAKLREAQGPPQAFRFLTARFIAVYIVLGVLLCGILYADFKAITFAATAKKFATKKAVAAQFNDIGANLNLIKDCEKSTEAGITQAGGTVRAFSKEYVKQVDGKTLEVVFTVDAGKFYTGVGHCTYSKGVYTQIGGGPGA